MDMQAWNKVFGEQRSVSLETYQMIVEEIQEKKHEYKYLSIDAFMYFGKLKGPTWINGCTSMEILQRTYLAILTGYLRLYEWIEGMLFGVSQENYLLFCSSTRGFLEAASDYYDAIERIPLSIAEQFPLFKTALQGKMDDRILGFDELEGLLLHFQEANEADGKKDAGLQPKSARSYMRSKNLESLNLYECYKELCEVTHPAKASLDLFLEEKDYIYTVDMKRDGKLIDATLDKYGERIRDLFERVDNLSIVTLKVINYFRIEHLYLECVERMDSDDVKIWKKIKEYM